jgi:hypothetical protein
VNFPDPTTDNKPVSFDYRERASQPRQVKLIKKEKCHAEEKDFEFYASSALISLFMPARRFARLEP